MATPTYDPIASTTLTSSASSVTFSSIPADYRDLVLVFRGGWSTGAIIYCQFNSDTTSLNYNWVEMHGDGSSASSQSSNSFLRAASYSATSNSMFTVNVMDYSVTDKHKSALHRHSDAGQNTIASAWRWSNTAAINAIKIVTSAGTLNSGSTFSLFGIVA